MVLDSGARAIYRGGMACAALSRNTRHQRLVRIREQLRENPKHPQAWHWQIQTRVLGCMLRLYGNDDGSRTGSVNRAEPARWRERVAQFCKRYWR